MAANRTRVRGRQIPVRPTNGAALSGAPGVLGKLPLVALNDAVSGAVTVDTSGVYSLSVKSIDAQINSGDTIYYVPGDTPKLSDDSDGASAVKFGIALGVLGTDGFYAAIAVANGATATIDVLVGPVAL